MFDAFIFEALITALLGVVTNMSFFVQNLRKILGPIRMDNAAGFARNKAKPALPIARPLTARQCPVFKRAAVLLRMQRRCVRVHALKFF